MYFGYAIAINPAAAYRAQYQAMLMQSLQKEIGQLKAESLKDDYQRGYEALIRGDTDKAIRLWEKESNLGVTQASKALGDIFHFKTKELPKALVYYGKAAEFGDLESAALMLAAKYHLDKLELTDLYAQPSSVQDQPWAKYVKASLIAETSEIDGDSEIWDLLGDAIEAGIVQALTVAGVVLQGMGEIQKAQEMFRSASDHGDNFALIKLIQNELVQEGLLKATESIIAWEEKFEWDHKYSYSVCSILRFMYYIPKTSAGKSENVRQAMNVATQIWSGYKKFDTPWDVFEREISRSQHNDESVPFRDVYISAYQLEGKHSAKVSELSFILIIDSLCSPDNVKQFLNTQSILPRLKDLRDFVRKMHETNPGDLETLTDLELEMHSNFLSFADCLLDALNREDWNSFRKSYGADSNIPEVLQDMVGSVLSAIK